MSMTLEDYEKFKMGALAVDQDGDSLKFITELQTRNDRQVAMSLSEGGIVTFGYNYLVDSCTLIDNIVHLKVEIEPSLFDLICAWAEPKGLLDPTKVDKQMLKLGEEFGELAGALAKGNDAEAFDSIGDMIVVLTILAKQKGWSVEAAVEAAYDEIKNRTGKTIQGVFIKDE